MEGSPPDGPGALDPDRRRRNANGTLGRTTRSVGPMNPPVATPFFFYLLAATVIIGGVLVITRKNAVHSAMALITIERSMKERQFNKQWLVGIAAAAALGGLFIAVYTTTTKGKALFPEGRMTYGETQNTQAIAALLFDRNAGQYMFAFEIASLLLLVAIIGAVVMAKKRI